MKKTKIAIIVLSVFTALLAASTITLGVLYGRGQKTNEINKNLLEAHYQQAYYTLIDETNDMEIKLAKLNVATGKTTQIILLSDISKSAEVSVSALSALSSADISIENTMRFINQTGDFANVLISQIQSGESFSEEQKESISKIYDMYVKLGTELSQVSEKINQGYLFLDVSNDAGGVLSGIFTELNDASVDYPTLIYDGPFSDSLNDKETKGLSGEDIDEAGGREILQTIFSDYELSITGFLGEWQADIPSLNYEITLDNSSATVQLSKQGGMLLSLNCYREVTNPELSDDECAELGRQFLVKAGFGELSPVWICNDNSTVFINYAPVMNGAIIYPDIIKVKIASDNGDVLGLESTSYAFNHTDRDIPSATLTAEQARQKLSMPDKASIGELCLIPTDSNAEILSYEFKVISGGTYYIYINALTGEEEEVLYVVSTTGGLKLV